MFEQLSAMIPRRRSVRSYLPDPVDDAMLAEIRGFMASLRPLIPGAAAEARIIPTASASFMQKWRNPQFLVFYAVEGEDALINVGFMYQQLDLYLQSRGLGSCWVGLGRPKKPFSEDLPHAILMPFGVAAEPVWREDTDRFTRKPLADIADAPDSRLECVRLAPSATNSQPWYFLHGEGALHVYQVVQGPLKRMTLGKMNCIDMGIALCHLALTCEGDFSLTRMESAPQPEGYTYIGTIPAL